MRIRLASLHWVGAFCGLPVVLSFAFLVVLCIVAWAPAWADRAYTTKVLNGDIGSARLVYGDSAQMGTLDALPAFTDIDAYELYYKFDDNNDCDDSCMRAVYRPLKANGRIRMLTAGTPVTVIGHFPDPQESQYEVCRLRLRGSSRTWLSLCTGLAQQP